jgi:pimeloyl-ACP methyl ester carboxylesterase
MQKSFEYKNTTISYRIEGQGKPVVLLHGFGEDSQIFNHQIEFLKDHCQLIVPDLPGSGKSQLLQHPASSIQHPVSIEDYAQSIQALLQHEKIPTCTLLGHSMGGYISIGICRTLS